MTNWQSIQTAPQLPNDLSGVAPVILLLFEYNGQLAIHAGYWCVTPKRSYWADSLNCYEFGAFYDDPIAWMPLPEFPFSTARFKHE